MKKKALTIFVLLLYVTSQAQKAVINGFFETGVIHELFLSRPLNKMNGLFGNENYSQDIPVKDGKFRIEVSVNNPEIMFLSGWDTVNNHSFYQPLFIKNGYRLNIRGRLAGDEFIAITTGTGSNDNQHFKMSNYTQLGQFSKEKDTVPDKIFAYIIEEFGKDSITIEKYIETNKPSPEFINAWKYELQYSVLEEYYSFEEERKFYISEAYKRNIDKWKKPLNDLFNRLPISDDNAMVSPAYISFLRDYLLRTKESIVENSTTNLAGVLKEWYGRDNTADPSELYDDMDNKLRQKIVEKKFTGEVKEYMYALLIENALSQQKTTNIGAVYTAFTQQFPYSRYRARFDNPVALMLAKLQKPLTDKMVFIPNDTKLDTWESVLALMKGKTVLLDMWGTWCVPCLKEISTNGPALKAYFKGKGLDFLYIANFDLRNEKKWKELIAYLDMEGNHLMANEKLNKDIMAKIKGIGYPTYAIIHRDGSFELSKAGYPMQRQKLIEQIEKALK